MKSLEELLKELPLQLQNEVREYAQYLVDTRRTPLLNCSIIFSNMRG